MRSRILWIVALVGCLVFAVAGFAQKGGKKGKKQGGGISVNVTFRDDNLDRIKSDGMVYRDGESKVIAGVGLKRGGFRLDTNRSLKAGAGRTVSFFFTQCVQDADCSLPGFGDEEVDVRLGEEFDFDMGGFRVPTGQKLNIVALDGGESAFGALVFNIPDSGRAEWWLIFGDNPFTQPCGDPVTVTRGGTADNPTNSWTLSADAGDEACLFEPVGDPGGEGLIGVLKGRFHMPFSINVVEQ